MTTSSKAIPASNRQRSQLAAKMIRGIHQKGASIPMTMVEEAAMQADLDAFNEAEADFGAMRKALAEAHKIFTPADAALTKWLNVARPALIGHFGYFWSANWAAAGFVNHSTSIPDTIVDRLGLARSLVAFFTANPTFENANTGATAAVGETKRQAADDAQGAVATAEQALKDQEIVREPATLALITDMRNVILNLTGKLAKDDPRWLAFGLEMPSTNTTPGKPTGLAAQFDPATGSLILTCDPQPYGERFRFRGREAGTGLPYQLIASAAQPLGRTKPIDAGTTLEIMVQAVNGGAQSVPSDSIIFTVPAAPTAKAETAPARTPLAAPATNGNGKANGNGTRSVTPVS